ncbi:saccharopine dehydrogenase family protein [Ketobacter alkanivorans]|uniref:Saccharopine dehydrogenase n=1 Tax=Ketobacter alkanivorans TaxID=1917421 RepID=A0A2K9LR17_9GAMM|nr:saccharopine dehydrogenase NADP-binding domain-containing protein [Ketobacter alkanivorans]AUM14581.1 saccharopine dehydrogenase [Ketobacter alkanivorans]MCP5013950.1 NmrA family NAD(P)-binding protein [Ketobacter sp.]
MTTKAATKGSERPFDIVVFGATGFTGKLTAEYLVQCAHSKKIKLAIAGRNSGKLEACKQDLMALNSKADIGTIEANSDDYTSLVKMAAQAKVVITTVGPYLKYGEPLVRACVEAGTHYVDLTGEPEFVEGLEHDYHDQAAAKHIKIINCCGFDSIPHDLGALYTVHELNKLIGKERSGKAPMKVEGFIEAKGTFSGGTWHSAITQFSRLKEYQKKRREWHKNKKTRPTDRRRTRVMGPKVFWLSAHKAWACPFPTIDPQVVKRTAAARKEFGPDFIYGHYVLVKKLPKLIGGVVGAGGLVALSQFKYSREKLLQVKDPGQGPSESTRKKSWFKVHFVGEADGLHVWTEVAGGDPGYGETAKMLAESALCLALDKNLPEEYGVTTPGAGMGLALIERLNAAGITFRTL